MALANKSDRLGTEKISTLLVKLSVPAIAGMVIQALYNIIDSIYIGRLSTEALSALSLCMPVQLMLIALGVGTGVGTSSLISRLLGQGRNHRANNAAEHVFLITILYGLIVGVIGFFYSQEIVYLFTDDPQLIDLAHRYIRIILVGSTAVFIPATFNYILRGEGNTFVPMLTMLIGAATFQALGKGLPSLLLTFLRQAFLLLPGMYLLGQLFGLDATWLAFVLAEGVTLLVMLVWQFISLKQAVANMRTA